MALSTAILERWIAIGASAWPGLRVTTERLGEFLSRCPILDEAHAAELVLACACSDGEPKALAIFEATYFDEVPRALKKLGRPAELAKDTAQIVRMHLFASNEGRSPKISGYLGQGSLRRWLRVVITRCVIDATAHKDNNVAIEDDVLSMLLGVDTNHPELLYMKEFYRDLFRRAFAASFRLIDADERLLLTYAFKDGLSVDVIARILGVHRATAARRVVKAHEKLAELVRKTVREEASISVPEYEQLTRWIQSQLSIHLSSRVM